jgi:RsiW-degrading membrane proteinase PrsW (M82 family)
MVYILLAVAVLPGLAICYYIWQRDKHEPEPKHFLQWCFFFGVISTVPAVLLEGLGQSLGIIANHDFVMTFMFAVFVVGLSEELSKFVFLRYYIYPKDEFDEPMDGIVYSVMISMGFATLENILYVFQGGIEVGILRMFTAVPAHAAFAVIMGYFVGMAKFHPNPHQRFMLLNTGLAGAVIIHGLYDFFIFQQNYPSLAILTLGTLVIAIIMSMKMIKSHVSISPHKDAEEEEEQEY